MNTEKCSPDEQIKIAGYARMPRIIRKGYKDLTKLQKLLYIYLRDLCGETGVCYRSLRTLADETEFSIGYLSKNIPALVDAGLIAAEMKKRNNQKWEVWHISIVDIWKQNAAFIQSEKCSPDEQNSVHDMNRSPDEQNTLESVHGMNENDEKCSRGAYKEEKVLNKNPSLNKNNSTYALTSHEQKIVDWYAELERRPRLSEKIKSQCAELAPHLKIQEDVNSLFAFSESRIRGDNKTVYLGNMVNDLKAWLRTRPKEEKPATPSQEDESKHVLWTRKPFKGNPLQFWYLFEEMTLAEARRQEKAFRELPPVVRQQIKRNLDKLAKGEIQIPEGVLIA